MSEQDKPQDVRVHDDYVQAAPERVTLKEINKRNARMRGEETDDGLAEWLYRSDK